MGSPRNRREKQRRRQKRAEKRRKARGPNRPRLAPFHVAGLPKMSDTLVVFAEPLLDEIADPDHLPQCRGALLLAAQVWNGLSLLERDDDDEIALGEETLDHVEEILTLDLGFSEEDVVELLDVLAVRKEALFPDENRLILSVDAERKGDRLVVHAASTFE